jgi:hypothetical protein
MYLNTFIQASDYLVQSGHTLLAVLYKDTMAREAGN